MIEAIEASEIDVDSAARALIYVGERFNISLQQVAPEIESTE